VSATPAYQAGQATRPDPQAYSGRLFGRPVDSTALIRSWQYYITTIKMGLSNEPHQCRYCNEVLSSKSKRDRHEQAHMKCLTCSESFSSTEALQKYLGDSGQCPKEFRCQFLRLSSGAFCGKRFLSREALDAHELEAHPEKYETCPTCGRKFNKISSHQPKRAMAAGTSFRVEGV
jgi:uncharacterized protein with PIN domain